MSGSTRSLQSAKSGGSDKPVVGVPVVSGPSAPLAPPETAPIKYPKVKGFMEQTGMQKMVADDHCHTTSDWLYIKHVGFNNIEVGCIHWYNSLLPSQTKTRPTCHY